MLRIIGAVTDCIFRNVQQGEAMVVEVRPPGERTIVVGCRIEIWRRLFDQPHSKNKFFCRGVGVTGKALRVAAAFQLLSHLAYRANLAYRAAVRWAASPIPHRAAAIRARSVRGP